MTNSSDRLYNLLPATYRIRDAAQGEPLRALLAIVNDELSEVEADIRGLYENWFIETSDEWVVPYIGDLLGVRGLNTLQNTSFSQRAYVANTLFYRRRKGTAYVLGILAGDVTGWPAHVVEFFELLQTTQYLNHLRLFNTMPDLRKMDQVDLLDTPFDSLPHTADVRHINNRRGKHNIPNIGIFLWRLQNYPLLNVSPRQAAAPHAHGYHFSQLGNPAPLFNAPTTVPLVAPYFGFQNGENEGAEQLVPAPIRPYDFFRDLKTFIQKTSVQAENYSARSSANVGAVPIIDVADVSQIGLETQQNEWTSYAGIDLTGQSSIKIRYSNDDTATSLEIRRGTSSGTLLGTCNLPKTASWDDFETMTCSISPTSGLETIVLVYKANCHVHLNWFNIGVDTANSRYYGPQRSLQITKDGKDISPLDVMCKDLRDWARPPAGKVAVDVFRGRISFAASEEPTKSLVVSYNYGFSADIGGGPYDRRERITEIKLPVQEFPVGAGKTYAKLADAVTDWEAAGKPPAVIRIYDSANYDANLSIALPANGMLVIDCENEERPTLLDAAPLKVASAGTTAEEAAAFTLSGLLIEGSLEVRGKLNLTISDCTLVPGISLDEDGHPEHPDQASLVVTGADVVDTAIVIARSILGPLELPELCQKLSISDSIVDAPLAKDADQPSRAAIAANATGKKSGPVSVLERVTVFGEVHIRELELASEVIFVHPVKADRRQEGCVRFSYVPEGSQTPRRYRCQPDLAIAAREKQLGLTSLPAAEDQKIVMRLRPQFTTPCYGLPAFAQLATACADEIKTGSEDGSEMGVFCMLQQPQRLVNLRIALDEYLRFGLEAGIFFVT